jgi:hypothetical protein
LFSITCGSACGPCASTVPGFVSVTLRVAAIVPVRAALVPVA